MRHLRWILIACLLATVPASPSEALMNCTFANPLIERGQDPSVVYHDGYYYLVQSSGGLNIRQSETISGLASAAPVTVYEPPEGEAYSYDLWAPEIFHHEGKWYIYVAATDAPGNNPTHRMYVLRADTDDPLGPWTMKGKVYDPEADKWAIDGIPFEYEGQLYFVWSGWPGDVGDFPQNLYIAEMSDPLTLSGPRHLLSEPDQPWERTVAALQEGPQVFMHDGALSIVYSADASWMPAYKLGVLHLTGDDPLDRNSWAKIGPVFEQNADANPPVYGPGHNSNPIPSPDSTESWFLYHAKSRATPGWDDRGIRAQPFTWNDEGVPVFGEPIPAGVAMPVPSGEPCGLVAAYDEVTLTAPDEAATGAFLDLGQPLLNTRGSYSVAAEVRLNDLDGPYAFVSQDGGFTSNFVLGFRDHRYHFTLFESMGQGSVSVDAQQDARPDEWVSLAGVFDARQQELALYVNGQLQATAHFDQTWDARGSTILGAARTRSQRVDLFNGDIRNVRFYNGALDADEVAALVE